MNLNSGKIEEVKKKNQHLAITKTYGLSRILSGFINMDTLIKSHNQTKHYLIF